MIDFVWIYASKNARHGCVQQQESNGKEERKNKTDTLLNRVSWSSIFWFLDFGWNTRKAAAKLQWKPVGTDVQIRACLLVHLEEEHAHMGKRYFCSYTTREYFLVCFLNSCVILLEQCVVARAFCFDNETTTTFLIKAKIAENIRWKSSHTPHKTTQCCSVLVDNTNSLSSIISSSL